MARFYVEETFHYLITADSEEEARTIQERVTVEGQMGDRVEFLDSEVQDFGANTEFEVS